MSVSSNYLDSLVGLAKAAYDSKVAKIQAEQSRKIGGTFTKDTAGKVTGYTPGTTGEYDVAYERNKKGLEAGLESRGILRSGQAGEARTRQLSDYKQSVIDYFNATQADINQAGADYALEEAKLRAQYGTTPEPATPTNVPSSTTGGGGTTPSMSLPAAERPAEASAAAMALGQPENRQAATGRGPVASTLPTYTEPMTAAAYMALGSPQSAAAIQKPPAPPKPPAPAKPPTPPAPPKPTPPKPATPPKPPAPAPVKKTTTVKSR